MPYGKIVQREHAVLMDRDLRVANRAALVLARAGAGLGANAEPFFQWAVKGVETQARMLTYADVC